MTAAAFELSTADDSSKGGPTDFARALLNILEDSASEQNQLRDAQNAALNILEDSASERGQFQDTQHAVLNTLEDFAEEKSHLEEMKRAVLNVLEDLGTERDKLQEAQVRLEQKNRELQDFTSVASHDLQEPLRKVQAFGDRLKTSCRAGMDEQGRDCLDRMLKATQRMQTLIRDLLAFAQVTSQAKPLLAVDLARVTQEVLSDLEIRIAETNALVEVGDLPTIDADATQMHQLLQNLIGNALKFHQIGKPPKVRVYAAEADFRQTADGMFRLVVQDEGIGFDEKYLDRIFAMFQRLHGRGEYEGTGVGLAICRKIAQRHGGDISAKSTPGEGASFLITLPFRRAHLNNPSNSIGQADLNLSKRNAARGTNSSLTSAEGTLL
jgi:light-regulated signal transduction histidine kinase (bacteriophytochrome)